ncbi:CoA transferase [Anaerolineae bacterium CFX9]|nr:CoA transferase [Anaerolineae bacterium CFX9]
MNKLPLNGLRVLDLTRLLPGAICTLMLADLGAEVIKIESPEGGDYARWMPPLIDGQGAYFQATNRGKQSVIVNLRLAAGQEVLHRLAQKADVLVESYRPGVLARMRGDAATLRAINPRLIYCSMSGWGQVGMYAERSGHDLNYAALSGMIGEMRTPQPVGGQVADVGGAYVAYGAIMTALFQRERTGQGSTIDTALFDAALPTASYAWVESLAWADESTAQRGVITGRFACYNIYRTQDDQAVALGALEPKFWTNFCAAIERPDLIPLHLIPDRQPYLMEEVAQIFASLTVRQWEERLHGVDCCFSVVHKPEALMQDSGVRERGILMQDDHGLPVVRTPVRMDADRMPLTSAPGYGEHTDAVLRMAGFDEAEIAALRQQSAVA